MRKGYVLGIGMLVFLGVLCRSVSAGIANGLIIDEIEVYSFPQSTIITIQ